MSLAAVLTAWAGFQATKWSGEQADGYSQAASTRVEATRSADLANQSSVADLITFTEWLAAAEREGLLADSPPGQTYVPDPDLLSGFLYQRFRAEFAVAVSAWLATSPRTNPDAPKSPFQMPEYKLEAQREADRLEARADRESERAREANDISDRYVLITIMLASVLFFAGIGSKMDTYRARVLLLGMGTALLLVSAVVVASFPKDF